MNFAVKISEKFVERLYKNGRRVKFKRKIRRVFKMKGQGEYCVDSILEGKVSYC